MNEPGDMDELALLADADRRAARYLAGVSRQRVFPSASALEALSRFDELLPTKGTSAAETLALLDDVGSPATVVSNGPRYFGFVIGASLPVASAAERLALAWDQCASSFTNSPVVATIEAQARRWVLEILDLPREAAVGFGTSATACTLTCLATARRELLARLGWNLEEDGLAGAPPLRVVVPHSVHVTVRKALRVLGFGRSSIQMVPVDAHSRLAPEALPEIDERTILCLQAGEVQTGEFDDFVELVARGRAGGAWIHVDGAFGLWARTSSRHRHLTRGVEGADSWTTDGHKWLNTPYDGALAICRNGAALSAAMTSDAVYAQGTAEAQRNLTLEFSRRGRGLPIWAALRTLGREGVAELVERHCAQAQRLAAGLRSAGYEICNRVVLNQVLARASTDERTAKVLEAAQASGELWFGPTVWQGRPAFRLSVSSWRTTEADLDRAIDVLAKLHREG